MQKNLLYAVVAVVFGVFLVVSPLFFIATFGYQAAAPLPSFENAYGEMRGIEKFTYGSDSYTFSSLDFAVLAACFFIALAVYLFVKRLQ